MFEAFGAAAAYLGNPSYWLAFSVAVLLAGLSGLVPGLGSPIVMSVALPFVVFTIQDPVIGLILLATIAGANNTLDSVPAVLIGIPGGATQVTYLEGHQLARQGKAAHTLGAIYAVSAIGSLVGCAFLLAVIPMIRPFILAFSFGEIAAVAAVGLAFIAVLGQGARIKGLAGALFGLLLGTIGVAPGSGTERFVFGQLFLWEGLPILATFIGILALPELIDLLISRSPVASGTSDITFKEVMRGFRHGLSRWKMTMRQSLLGAGLGAVPGLGAPVIDWMSYSFGILFSKDRSKFGKGSLEGVLFTESAQNAKEGGQAIPTLALGIPSGAQWAIVVTAMMAYQISPGPQMLDQYAHITLVLVFTLAIANVGLTMLGLAMTPTLGRLTLVPYPAIGAIAIPLILLSSFLSSNDVLGVVVTLVMCVVGLLMKKHGWPRPPLLIGFILGPIIEENLLNAISVQGGLLPALARPITLVLLVLVALTAVTFHILMKRSMPAPAVASAPMRWTPGEVGRRFTAFRFQWDQLLILGLALIALLFLLGSRGLPVNARIFPVWLCWSILVLAAAEFLRTGLTPPRAKAQIFDLGMMSGDAEGARKACWLVLLLFVIFMAVSAFFGLSLGAVAFAICCPLVMLEGRYKIHTAVAAGLFIAFFVFYFIDVTIGIVWPEPMIGFW